MNGKVKASPDFRQPHRSRRTTPIMPSGEQIKQAAEMLISAGLPIIHAGSGIYHAQAFEELETVAGLLHAPVTKGWAARGAFRDTSELAIPMVDVQLNHRIRNAADVVLTPDSRIRDAVGDDAILVADGGNTAIWANFYWPVRKAGTILSTFSRQA